MAAAALAVAALLRRRGKRQHQTKPKPKPSTWLTGSGTAVCAKPADTHSGSFSAKGTSSSLFPKGGQPPVPVSDLVILLATTAVVAAVIALLMLRGAPDLAVLVAGAWALHTLHGRRNSAKVGGLHFFCKQSLLQQDLPCNI